jgi:DHA1 family inner membrane transport protein
MFALLVNGVAQALFSAAYLFPSAVQFIALIGLLGWGTAAWAIYPPLQVRLISSFRDDATAILALSLSTIYLGVALGSALGSLLVRDGALRFLGIVGGTGEIVALLLAGCWLAARWRFVVMGRDGS